MNYNPPYLEKYTGGTSRHECPACGDKHSFVYYMGGNTGEAIHPTVGRCNHESSCGYHYTPKQYFIDNPAGKNLPDDRKSIYIPPKRKIRTIRYEHIPQKYFHRSLGPDSHFVSFLQTLFGGKISSNPILERVATDYRLGCTKDKRVIFWQIDRQGNIRAGKIMQYDPLTGHRIKDAGGAIDWVHSALKKKGLLPEDFQLVQCLFGEHLLNKYPDKVVALVESEKSAAIASVVFPDYVWLATGGKSQLSRDKLKVLKGRSTILFPDVDAYLDWAQKAKELERMGYRVVVSDLLEKNASPRDREDKIDLADWVIRDLASQFIFLDDQSND